MPPYYGMPYGPAPAYCYPLTEISVYCLFIICLIHSLKNQGKNLAFLTGGLLFGLLLEFVDVYFLKGYTYGRFMVMLGQSPLDIPFWIGVGWGVIMYSSRLFTDNLGLSNLAAAALDAILALNIDCTMDIPAYRLHMWDWGWFASKSDPLNSQWFGIPYDNYFGWLMVVFTYSYFSRIFVRIFYKRLRGKIWPQIFTAISAILVSEIILFSWFNNIKSWLVVQFNMKSAQFLIIFLLLLAGLILTGWNKRNKKIAFHVSYASWIVPAWFHIYFFIWFFIGGFNHENNRMTFFALTNLVFGIVIHLRYFEQVFGRKEIKRSI
jgi:hypothetical protein